VKFEDRIFAEQDRITAIVESAGKKLLDMWPANLSNSTKDRQLFVAQKHDKTFVTEADLASNNILKAGLTNLFPEVPIVSEESDQAEKYLNNANGYFLIDPLDGTSRFIEGADDFAVLLAYINSEGFVRAGWVYFPAMADASGVLYASIGGKLVLERGVNKSPSLKKHLDNGGIYLRKEGKLSLLPPEISSDSIHSGEAFRLLFCGELSGVILQLGRLGIWDIAAPLAIVEALGGQGVNLKGQPFKFSNNMADNPVLLGGASGVIPELINISKGIFYES
jgi:3'(2'), 5'-bisphosphate nucleotidase